MPDFGAEERGTFRFGPSDYRQGSAFRYRYRFDPQGPNPAGALRAPLRRSFGIGPLGTAIDTFGIPSSGGSKRSLQRCTRRGAYRVCNLALTRPGVLVQASSTQIATRAPLHVHPYSSPEIGFASIRKRQIQSESGENDPDPLSSPRSLFFEGSSTPRALRILLWSWNVCRHRFQRIPWHGQSLPIQSSLTFKARVSNPRHMAYLISTSKCHSKVPSPSVWPHFFTSKLLVWIRSYAHFFRC